MRHVKIGLANTLGEMNFLRQFLSWNDLMKLIQTTVKDGQRVKYLTNYENIDLLKSVTVYDNCDANHEQVTRFWTIY